MFIKDVYVLGDQLCCHDEWSAGTMMAMPNQNNTMMLTTKAATLTDTASGAYLSYKMVMFAFEGFLGAAMLLSHVVIWYFCHERHVQYGQWHLKDADLARFDSRP